MKIFKLILMMGVALISSSCAYSKIDLIPIAPPLVKTDSGKPFPFEAGLLITEKTREQVFQSKTFPERVTDYYYYTFEPYRLPVGQAFKEASRQIFSRVFQKVHLIRSPEEGKKYPLIIEPKLMDFDFHLLYSTLFTSISYQTAIDILSKAKVSGTLKINDRAIWENSVKTPLIIHRWIDEYQMKEKIGQQASETITTALEELAAIMVEESRRPQSPRGWMEELNPRAPDPGGFPETKK